MEHFNLSAEVMATVPVTDIRHVMREISEYRHVKAIIKEQNKKLSIYNNEYKKKKKTIT